MTDDSDADWVGEETRLRLVNDALDRELSDYGRRDSSMQSRGTILVGAASVVGAIQLSSGFQPASVVHLVLSFLAAVAGVIVLFPRKGDGFNPRTLRDQLMKGTSVEEATHHMVRVKLDALDDDEKSLIGRGRIARLGFIFLALGVLAAAVGAVVPVSATPAPGSTPTVSVTHVP